MRRVYSHAPHPISCPYKMTGFLPSTYKMEWRCGSLCPSLFSNMQLKTLDCSKLFGFLTPIMWFLPKNTGTHTERTTGTHTHRENNIHDHLLICFLIVLSLETEKMQRTLLCLFPSIWVLGARWVYYKMGILKLITHIGFGFF